MRLSVEDLEGDDPEKARLCIRAVIMLNGVECGSGVIVADEEQGFIERYMMDENGQMVVTADNSEFVTEIVHGVVKIIDPQAKELDK